MLNDDKRKGLKSMLKGKALYITLGTAFLTAGIAGYMASGVHSPKFIPEQGTAASRFENYNDPVFEPPVSDFSDGIEIDITLPSEPPEPPEPSEPRTEAVFDLDAARVKSRKEERVLFTPPLPHGAGKDYSRQLPVFSETMGDYRTHNGVDFKGEIGEKVLSIGEGKVISVKKSPVWGNSVTVDHGGGVVSEIFGLSDEGLIENLSDVDGTSVIGAVGKIPVESADAPHIHLEIRKDGVLSDPLELLGLD